MMLSFCHFAFTFLCSISFPSSVHSIQCAEGQYSWEVGGQQLCCNMCQPGYHLRKRCTTDKQTVCEPCIGRRYRDTINIEWSCNICESCNKSNMEYMLNCNHTQNAVCKCKAGYECKDQACKQCSPVQPTIRPMLTRFSTDLTPLKTAKSWTIPYSWWVLMGSSLLSTAIIISLVMKNKNSILRWIRPKYVSTCSEDEEVSKPVQEAGIAAYIKIDPELQ